MIDFIGKLIPIGLKIRGLLNEGPGILFYTIFWWCFPETVLRNKAAHCPYANLKVLLLRVSGVVLGEDCRIGYGTLVLGMAKNPRAVTLGNRVAGAPYVTFISSSYPVKQSS